MSSELEFKGYALTTSDPDGWKNLKVTTFKPKIFESDDVEVAITHCGVCGSDVHTITQGWGPTARLPLVAGHEIVGKATRVGERAAADGFKVGDRVGVGAQVGSCGECRICKDGLENYCPRPIHTYSSVYPDGTPAQGGYATAIRAHRQFVFPIPDGIESRDVASMLCAGLTAYAPLRENGAGPGKKVGVVGIGGIGHYAVLFAKAMGAEVYAFTHGSKKIDDIRKMGADHVVVTSQKDFNKPYLHMLDIIIFTVDKFGPDLTLRSYLSMLYAHGKFINVGLPDADSPFPTLHAFDLSRNGCLIGGSHIGSKEDCVEMLKLAAEKGVRPWVEELPMSKASVAIEGVLLGKPRYRYVLKQDLVEYAS